MGHRDWYEWEKVNGYWIITHHYFDHTYKVSTWNRFKEWLKKLA